MLKTVIVGTAFTEHGIHRFLAVEYLKKRNDRIYIDWIQVEQLSRNLFGIGVNS